MKRDITNIKLSGMALIVLFALSPLIYGSPVPSFATKNSKIKTIESRLSVEKQKYEECHSHEKDIMTELAELEQEVAGTKLAIAESDEKIRLSKIRFKQLRQNLFDIRDSLEQAKMNMANRLAALYKYARRAYINVLINVHGPNQFQRRLKYLKSIIEQDIKAIEQLTEKKRNWEANLSCIENEMAVIKADNHKEEQRLLLLKQDLDKKVIKLMKIHEEKKFYQTAIKELQTAAKDMKDTISAIEKKEIYKTTKQENFEDLKGKLPFPINGKMVSSKRLSVFPNPSSHKGVFFEAISDRSVKAVYPGRVDFSGRIKGYGDVIVINHGSRYYTISACLFRRKCREGDLVNEGMTIGLVGNNLSSGGARLYFEIRKGKKALEPLEWLKNP